MSAYIFASVVAAAAAAAANDDVLFFSFCFACCCCCYCWLFVCMFLVFVLFFPLLLSFILFRFLAWFSISLTCSIYIHVIFFCTLVLGSTNVSYYISVKLSVISLFYLLYMWWSTRKLSLLWSPYTFYNLYCNYLSNNHAL